MTQKQARTSGFEHPTELPRKSSNFSDLSELDYLRDLPGRSLHISSEGYEWRDTQALETYPKRLLLDFFYWIVLTRGVDLEMVKLSRKGLALGKVLRCVGNEASAVGAAYGLREDEWVTTAIRDLGAFLLKGISVEAILGQSCGRIDGVTKGWDGSLHIGSRKHHLAGLVSHLATLVCTATGCAFQEVYRNTDNATLAFIGDGSTSTGDFHEALNIASVLRLPLVVVVENNQWAFGTPGRQQYATPTLAMRALAYGPDVRSVVVDGTDVLAVYECVSAALERARTERKMTIVETVSMRMDGHSVADPFSRYVPADQLAIWKEKDPIATFRARLLGSGFVAEDELVGIEERIRDEILQATLAVEASPAPSADNLTDRVFVPAQTHGAELLTPRTDGHHLTYHQAIRDALDEELSRDPNLFIIGEDIGISDGAFKITEGFSKKYDGLDWASVWNTKQSFTQRRVVDAPLAEAGFTGLAIGAVLAGLRAVVEFQYADFSSEAFKMLVNYAATETVRGMGPLPIVFRMPSGWAPSTSIYHSVNPESWYASTPGLKIVAPATAFDAKGLLKAAIRDGNPVIFLEYKHIYRPRPSSLPRALDLPIPDEDYYVPIGKARVVKAGTDLSIITYGSQVHRALEAALLIEKEDGASIEVLDLRSLVPFDREAIRETTKKTNKVLVTCEAPRTGCFGNTIVAEVIDSCFDYLDAPVRLLAAADTPVPFAPNLEKAHLPTTEKIVAIARELLAY